jgi:WD40 repeat protein
VQTFQERAALSAHNGAVLGVCFSPDGKTLASCGADQTIKLWEAYPRQTPGGPTSAPEPASKVP